MVFFNFRDYFPNFILPSNDTLFDDLDLDACQMFDFVKKNIKMTEKQIDEVDTRFFLEIHGKLDHCRN